MSILVQLRNLTKSYGKGQPAVDNLNLNLESGRIIGLLGPNGSGKTTVIKMINGLLKPTKGEVLIDGQPADRAVIPAPLVEEQEPIPAPVVETEAEEPTPAETPEPAPEEEPEQVSETETAPL